MREGLAAEENRTPPPSFMVTDKDRATRATLRLETLATLALEELAIAFHLIPPCKIPRAASFS